MDIPRPPARQQFPPDAKKVFSGVLFDVYQWEQALFDGSKATYERLRRGDSIVVLPVTEQGTILISRTRQPGTPLFTTVTCGGIEPGEAPDVAALRELREETGYEPKELDFWFAHQVDGRIDWAIYVFIARGCRKVVEANPGGGEEIAIQEVSFDEFLRAATADDFQTINIAPKLLAAVLDPQAMIALKKRLGVQ